MPRGNERLIGGDLAESDELVYDAIVFARACMWVGLVAVVSGLVLLDWAWGGLLCFLLFVVGLFLLVASGLIRLWVRRQRKRISVVEGNANVSEALKDPKRNRSHPDRKASDKLYLSAFDHRDDSDD